MSDGPVETGSAAPVDTAAQTQTTSAQQELAKLFKVTVDGSELEVDENELKRGYAHGKAANERMRQANETRQQAEEVLKIFKENPRLAFEKLGVDAKTFAENYLSEQMEEAMLTDDQKEMRRLKKWESEMKAREDAQRAEQQAAQEAAFREQVSAQLQDDILGTLKSSGLPQNEYTVGRMAYFMEAAVSAGFTNISAKDIIGHVRQEYERDVKALLGSVPEDNLLSFLGDDFTKKTVKAHLAKVGVKKPTKTVASNPSQGTATNGKKIMSPSEFFRKRK